MFVSKCPLRISLVGGSTDQEQFIQKYGSGGVISFPSNLFAYISVHKNNREKFIINYSTKEEVDDVGDIKNDIARVCLQYFNINTPTTITFNNDILSSGSGLATSSAYTIALVKALSMYQDKNLTDFDICELALGLERKFNPLTGYQDPYGCGIGGFKKITFTKKNKPSFTYLGSNFIMSNFNMALYYTGTPRNSTNILSTLDLDKSLPLLYQVDWMEQAIQQNNISKFLEIFKEGWEVKKRTSEQILADDRLKELDKNLLENDNVLGVKLCGAGGSGFFLVLFKSNYTPPVINNIKPIKIKINETGVVGTKI